MSDVKEQVHYLDRRIHAGIQSYGGSVTYVAATDTTTWTVPYTVATDGSQGTLVVCLLDPSMRVPAEDTSRPSTNSVAVQGYGDLRTEEVYLGLLYDTEIEFDAPTFRDREGKTQTGGWLTIRFLEALLESSVYLKAEVTVDGQTVQTHTFNKQVPTDDMGLRAAIQSRADRATIKLLNDTPAGFYITGLDWEGTFTRRNRRL